jgi:hypothetical protein
VQDAQKRRLRRLRGGLGPAGGKGEGVCMAYPRTTGGVESFGRTLERGGELADARIDAMTVQMTEHSVSTWGLLEVPDGSRLSAAYAGADALARAELLKLVRVRVAGEMVSVDSSDPARRDAYEHTVEQVSGTVRSAGTLAHGWARVRREARVFLRVCSRLTVPRAQLAAALATTNTEAELVPSSEAPAPR